MGENCRLFAVDADDLAAVQANPAHGFWAEPFSEGRRGAIWKRPGRRFTACYRILPQETNGPAVIWFVAAVATIG